MAKNKKPRFVKQEGLPNTDHKFRQTDEHLVEQEKRELSSGQQGDPLTREEKRVGHTPEPDE